MQQGDGKQEQLENLSGGAHSDNDPSLQPQNTYRYGLNGNLITRDGNHFSFESVKGTVLSFTLPTHIDKSAPVFMPIGMPSMGNYMVVYSTATTSAKGGDGEIGKVVFDEFGVGTYTALYYHKDLNFSQAYMIGNECYGLPENDSFHRVYWSDDFNQPRTMNVVASIFTTYISSGDLVDGETYMVLTDSEGYITYDGTNYGPLQAAGNVFVANAINVYTSNGAQVNVIVYLNPDTFNYTPARAIGSIDFKSWAYNGQLHAGAKMYAYRLYTSNGYQGSWTYTTNPIHVEASNGSIQGGYQNYTGSNGGTNTGKSVTLTISDIPIDIFDKIQVAVIKIDSTYEVATDIEIFWDTDITGESMDITHYGQEDLETLLLDDLILRDAVILRCKTMATTKQRQEQANLTTVEQVIDDGSGVVEPFIYSFPADDEPFTNNNYGFDVNSAPAGGIVPADNLMRPDGIYLVKGTVGVDIVEYPVASGHLYGPGQALGEAFVGVFGSYTFAINAGAPTVKGCIRIQLYTDNTSNPVYKYIEMNDEYFGYKSMAYNMYLRGYWRSTMEDSAHREKYRFAKLFFDKFGNPMFAQWFADVDMPTQSEDTGGGAGEWKLLTNQQTGNTTADTRMASLHAMGMKVSGVDITKIADKIGGIAIVRVPRDKRILGQGILHQCIQQDGSAGPSVIVPTAITGPDSDWNVILGGGGTTPYYWSVSGPEFDFGLAPFPIPLVAGDELNPVADYEPLRSTNGGRTSPYDTLSPGAPNGETVYSKYYVHNTFTPVDSPYNKISQVHTLVAGGTYPNIDVGVDFNNGDIAINAGTPAHGAIGDLIHKGATGDLRTIMLAAYDYINLANAGKGTGVNPADTNTKRKPLVNYFRPKGELYGGDSDAAKANNRYMFCGHYLAITPELLADIIDRDGNYILNGMDVWGGDCFVNLYDRVSALWNDEYSGLTINGNTFDGTFTWGLIFPCESEINVGLRQGLHMGKNPLYTEISWIGGGAADYSSERFNYNEAYSSENKLIKYDALPLNFKGINRFPYMARYSEKKVLGEAIDNMRRFLTKNFINVDALHGEITKIVVGNDFLFYLQERGVGYLPIEERELISAPIAGATQLGVGGVIERFDTKDYFYGCQHKHSVLQTENGWSWFDMRRKAHMAMTIGQQAIDVSVMKGKQAFFANIFDPYQHEGLTDMFVDTPLLGYGIIGYYDAQHKTAFLTFKYGLAVGEGDEAVITKKDFTIGFNNQLDKYVDFFSFVPAIAVSHNGFLFATNESKRVVIQNDTAYSVGNQLTESNVTYICIVAYTSANPAIQPTSDNTHWVAINQENQISNFWNGDICKFFGAVYPYELEVVFGANSTAEEKAFDNIEVYGNQTAFTDVYHQTSELTSQDINIKSTNKNFAYIDNAWWFSVALTSKSQRMFDRWMKSKVVVKNYLTNPTISIDKVKRIVYLRLVNRFIK